MSRREGGAVGAVPTALPPLLLRTSRPPPAAAGAPHNDEVQRDGFRDTLEVRTAENVGIGYDTAGIGSRVLAFLVDLVVVSLVAYCLDLLVIGLFSERPEAAAIIAGSVSFFAFLLGFIVCEATTGGSTPGKRALGLRVVRVDGGACGLTEALLRGLARIVDLPFGMLPMFFHPQARRFGDLVAGTVVVRERRALASPPPPPPVLLRTPDAGPAIDHTERLGQTELAAIRAFLSRPGVGPEQRSRVAAAMAGRLLDRLALPDGAPERQWPPELLLERLYLQLAARSRQG